MKAVLVGLSGGGLDTDGSGESADDDLGDAEFLEVFCQVVVLMATVSPSREATLQPAS